MTTRKHELEEAEVSADAELEHCQNGDCLADCPYCGENVYTTKILERGAMLAELPLTAPDFKVGDEMSLLGKKYRIKSLTHNGGLTHCVTVVEVEAMP